MILTIALAIVLAVIILLAIPILFKVGLIAFFCFLLFVFISSFYFFITNNFKELLIFTLISPFVVSIFLSIIVLLGYSLSCVPKVGILIVKQPISISKDSFTSYKVHILKLIETYFLSGFVFLFLLIWILIFTLVIFF
jgi:hypothetical protein